LREKINKVYHFVQGEKWINKIFIKKINKKIKINKINKNINKKLILKLI